VIPLKIVHSVINYESINRLRYDIIIDRLTFVIGGSVFTVFLTTELVAGREIGDCGETRYCSVVKCEERSKVTANAICTWV
jgi:hypothetical protein